MSNKTNNERLQELEKENDDLKVMLAGARKENDKLAGQNKGLRMVDIDITRALLRYENLLVCRLVRFVLRRKRPSDIIVERME